MSLTAAAKETTTLGLGTGVTNPMTRHATVAASAFSTLQVVSNGRAYLGISRDDSALAHLGYSPTSAGAFEDCQACGQDRPDAGRQRETDPVGHGTRARGPADGGGCPLFGNRWMVAEKDRRGEPDEVRARVTGFDVT